MVRDADLEGGPGRDRVPGRRAYAPPRIERFGKLDEVAQFGGSTQNDSGSLGNQPGPPIPGSRHRG
jgi:hypothetical protein